LRQDSAVDEKAAEETQEAPWLVGRHVAIGKAPESSERTGAMVGACAFDGLLERSQAIARQAGFKSNEFGRANMG